MANKYFARVYEIWTGSGTGAISLGGTIDGSYQAFGDVFANGETTDIIIFDNVDFESCQVTYNSSGNTLTRGTIGESSNGGARVNFSAGTIKKVMCVAPAKRWQTIFGNVGELFKVAGPTALRTFTFPDADCSFRQPMTAARTYYVRKDGSDANSGLADNGGGAKLTIQAAINAMALNDDLRRQTGVIQVRSTGSPTTYNEDLQLLPIVGSANAGNVVLRGDTTTPSNIIINGSSNCISAIGYMPEWLVEGFKFTSGGYAVQGHAQGWIRLGKVEFGACTSGHVFASHKGIVEFMQPYTISGGATHHALAMYGGYILNIGVLCTLTGTPAFTSFATAFAGSLIEWAGGTFSGSATGNRYLVNGNSVIDVTGTGAGGGSATFFPGNVAGSSATGGQYT